MVGSRSLAEGQMPFSDVPSCGARRRDGGTCRQPAMRPSGKCRMHGGRTPRGLANANTRTGRYSRDLPTRLNARYEIALTDPELTSIRKDVALLQAILDDRLAAWADQDADPDGSIVLDADLIAE